MLRRILLPLFFSGCLFGQDTLPSDSSFFSQAGRFSKKRTLLVAGTEAGLAGGSLAGLATYWYRNYPHGPFHFFNDNSEWLQMDKIGHATSSYYTGRVGMNLLRWSGVNEKKATWYGGLTGFAYLTAIEIFDGFSSQWGFSAGDMTANTLGSALLISQQLCWKEQRLLFKFSSHRTNFPVYRPELLGKNRFEQIIKDYNGQTYWLSVNIASFLRADTKIPPWLNLALGYGAEGMTGGKENAVVYNPSGNRIDFPRYRQYYLSLDIDLTKIGGRSPFMRAVTEAFGFIKIPAPALAFDRQGFGAYWLYF